jgi:hypothetical protein
MYKIIGGDQKEYGPVSADELRRWISEGRLNGQSRIRAEAQTDWQPLSSFPEFADALQAQIPASFAGAPGGSSAPATSEEILAREPHVEIGRCLSQSGKLLSSNFGLLYGATFLAWLPLLVQVIPLAGPFLFLLLNGVFYGGLYLVFLRRIRGQPATVADAYSGFRSGFAQLLLVGLLTSLLTGLGMCCCILPGVYLLVAWTFSIPLVADRGLEFWSSMELSRKVVTRIWFPMFGLLIVAFVPTIVAYLILNVLVPSPGMPGIEEMIRSGQFDPKRVIDAFMQAATANVKRALLFQFILFLNLPFAVGALMYAYEDLFGARTSRTA